MIAARLLALSLLAAPALGCGGDDGASDADAGVDAMIGDPDVFAGRFTVDLIAPVPATGTTAAVPGYTTVLGVVYDRTPPEAIIWDVTMTEGSCVLRIPRVPFCETPCGGSAVCVADDTCAPYATKQDVGLVHAKGLTTTLGATELDLTLLAGSYQVPGAITLAYPAFQPGAAVTFTAAGSSFTPAFELVGAGIGPLALTSTDLALARNQALNLTWTPAAAGASSRITVALDISHHGGSKGKIECDAPDTGSLTLTAAIMTRLLDLGAAGFPTIIVTRQGVSSALVTSGRVDLVLQSRVERAVTVPGITSCTDDDQCPMGQTCQPDLTCR